MSADSGTGRSADTADPSDVDSYRADRLVDDVEALRVHLGLQTMDLLGHSAGAHVAVLYTAAHPERIGALALITGGHRAVGAMIEGAYVSALELRSDEPDVDAVRENLSRLGAPVLVYAGELDLSPRPAEAARLAEAFPQAQLVVQPAAGHFPWVDDPAYFVDALIAPAPDHMSER